MYHPDDDGGALQWLMDSELRCAKCGSEDGHKVWCPLWDDLPADPDDEEEDEDEEDELFTE